MNTGSLPLSPQELRRALKPGHLIDILAVYTEESEGIKKIFRSKNPDPRMKDVELILRYISFEVRIENYDGDFKSFLDSTCDLFDNDWPVKAKLLTSLCNKFDSLVNDCFTVFGEGAFKKYSKDGYESRFNRAVFDIQMYYLGLPSVSTKINEKAKEIEAGYKQLCRESEQFNTSISVNTMNLMNFSTRFVMFGQCLETVLQLKELTPKSVLTRFEGKL